MASLRLRALVVVAAALVALPRQRCFCGPLRYKWTTPLPTQQSMLLTMGLHRPRLRRTLVRKNTPRNLFISDSPLGKFFDGLQNVPKSWGTESFICDSIQIWLPARTSNQPEGKTLMVLQPRSSKLWPSLRHRDDGRYIDDVWAVEYEEMDEGAAKAMRNTANAMGGAGLKFFPWKKIKATPTGIPTGAVDFAFIEEGTLAKLGRDVTQAAFKMMFRVLKDSGRLFVIASMADERSVLGGQLELGFEPKLLQQTGWQVAASVRGEGVCVAYLRKARRRITSEI
eukprot:TRINITY_DN41548_c0_g1_i1.p1 TRINITY_DN41548_c0_g1~~TRINITY_DN41548_c0_g1_i1.p1  ORF type:complete len:283 (-),score=38.61 TRINITY_DN41548_c0_g1_i1:110-958(-)